MSSAAPSLDASAIRNPNRLANVARVLLTYPQCGEEKDSLVEFLKTIPDYQCCVVGQENHHATEGLHLHAFLRLERTRKIRANTLNTMFNWQVGEKIYHPNIELVKNSKADIARVVKYVIKDGNYTHDNCDPDTIISGAHKKKYNTKHILETDIMVLVENNEIRAQDFMSILKAQQTYRLLKPIENCESTRGIWLHGKSGTGKSTWARAFGIDHGGFFLKQQNKWWDGYKGEKVVIIDDLDTGTLNHYLKIWGDKWATTGEVKGATINLSYEHLIITSNYSIEQIVGRGLANGEAFDNDLYESLARRFKLMEIPQGQKFFKYDGEHVFTNDEGEILTKKPPKEPGPFEGIPSQMEGENSQEDSIWDPPKLQSEDSDTALE